MTDEASTTEATVDIQELCRRWEIDPKEAAHLQKFMGQDGPWTEAQVTELDRRMGSMEPEDLFPGFTGEKQEWARKVTSLPTEKDLLDALASALRGLPEGEASEVPDTPMAAILDALDKVQGLLEAYGRATGRIGAATVMLGQDPLKAAARLREEITVARRHYQSMHDVVLEVATRLPEVRGTRAVDAEGVPIWYKAATGDSDWLTTAQAESPGEGWRAVYV